jgi:hypothetical protein
MNTYGASTGGLDQYEKGRLRNTFEAAETVGVGKERDRLVQEKEMRPNIKSSIL